MSLAKIGTARGVDARRGVGLEALPFDAARSVGEREPALEREPAQSPGRKTHRDLRRLDRDRPRAAARVVQRAATPGRAAPAGGGEHRRGERLLERRFALVGAPAALEQRLARAVHVDRGAFSARVEDDLQVGPRGVDVRPLAVLVAHPVADGVLDAQRGEVEAPERAALRGRVDAQRLARGDPLRPVDRARQRIQIALVAVRSFGDLDQHPLCKPALEIEEHHLARVAGERDTAAHRPHLGAGQERAYLGVEQRLGPGGTGEEQGQRHRRGRMAGERKRRKASRRQEQCRRGSWVAIGRQRPEVPRQSRCRRSAQSG